MLPLFYQLYGQVFIPSTMIVRCYYKVIFLNFPRYIIQFFRTHVLFSCFFLCTVMHWSNASSLFYRPLAGPQHNSPEKMHQIQHRPWRIQDVRCTFNSIYLFIIIRPIAIQLSKALQQTYFEKCIIYICTYNLTHWVYKYFKLEINDNNEIKLIIIFLT